MAIGLIRAGHDVRYVTSASWGDAGLVDQVASSPILQPLSRRIGLDKRALPRGLPDSAVVRRATLFEALTQVATRVHRPWDKPFFELRNRVFARQLSRLIRRSGGVDLVIAQSTSAAVIFAACTPAQVKVLSYPIAHHAWTARKIAEEARINPGWKEFLQGGNLSQSELRRLNDEVSEADYVLVPSNFVKNTFIAEGVAPEKLLVANLGADLSALFGQLRTAPESAESRRRPRAPGLNVLFAGQLTQRKGISYLLDAFQMAALPGSELTLIGKPMAGIVDKIQVYPNVKVLPSLRRSELGDEYRRADVLVLPSLSEGFPLVAIEAMACGTACIVSEFTFADDVITDGVNGFVVPAQDTEALSAVLVELARDELALAALGRRAQIRAGSFTWDEYHARVSAILSPLIRTKARA